MKNQTSRVTQLERTDLCSICHKRPIEIFQLDTECCCECWQKECFVSFVDQVDIPDV